MYSKETKTPRLSDKRDFPDKQVSWKRLMANTNGKRVFLFGSGWL